MPQIRDWTIRARLLLAFVGILIPYLALAGVGLLGVRVLWQSVQSAHDETMRGVKLPADLQVAILQLVMPPNDFLITGDPREREVFEHRLARVHEVFARAETSHHHAPEERQLLETVKSQIPRLEALGREILALSDPRKDRAAWARMKALDGLAEEPAALLTQVREIALREIEEGVEQGAAKLRRLLAVGIATLILSVVGGLASAFILSDWLGRPILAITEGSRRMGEGDLSHRLETRTGGELRAAALAFNKMAERLEASALENARLNEQVAEYAKGLERKVEERAQALQAAQLQLVQSEKLAAVGTLAAGVAHELNQPLMVIRGYAQELLADPRIADPEIQEDLRRIEGQTGRMVAIIVHLRDFSRQSKGQRQATDLNQVVTQAFTFVGQQLKLRNIAVVQELTPGLPPVWADTLQIEQVLLNLITNARDAVEGAGTGTLTIRTAPTEDGRVALSVTDTGPGIPPEVRARMFDPFYTTKEVGKGTGLGLSICHGIVQEHGGEIQVESPVENGRGSRFTLRLPCAPRPAEDGVARAEGRARP